MHSHDTFLVKPLYIYIFYLILIESYPNYNCTIIQSKQSNQSVTLHAIGN